MARSDEILEFWFGDAPEERLQKWFSDQPEFDRQCREAFLVDYECAAKGLLDGWQEGTANCLALVLLLDQLPRTIFRNTPRAYASDAKAREVARRAIVRGFDRQLPPLQRVFFYMPLEHSEDLVDQEESLWLQRQLAKENPECAIFVKYAEEHLATVAQFGRFPQRNAILGRVSTPREARIKRARRTSPARSIRDRTRDSSSLRSCGASTSGHDGIPSDTTSTFRFQCYSPLVPAFGM
jgi:uncharacterized protein (DUF924 family)